MKNCPVCALAIQDAAVRCRYCKNWIVTPLGGAPYPTLVSSAPASTSGLAIASMVLGILWIYWIGSIVALVLGYLALREIRKDPQRMEGRGMALAGIVFGWVGVATLILVIILGVYFFQQDEGEKPPSREPARAAEVDREGRLVCGGDMSLSASRESDFLFLGPDGFVGRVRGNDPERGVGQEPANQLRVQRMARFMRFNTRLQGQPRQGQVANEIQSLVAAKFVRETQRAVHDAVLGEDDGIIEGAAADEAHGPKGRNVALEAEGSRPG